MNSYVVMEVDSDGYRHVAYAHELRYMCEDYKTYCENLQEYIKSLTADASLEDVILELYRLFGVWLNNNFLEVLFLVEDVSEEYLVFSSLL